MESVKISPKKCKLAIALAGHHSGSITLTIVQKTAQLPLLEVTVIIIIIIIIIINRQAVTLIFNMMCTNPLRKFLKISGLIKRINFNTT